MLKLFKYLKKNAWQIVLIILLLILQANLDLTLPEYTSKIINVGIQQNGIESGIYQTICESTLSKIEIFLSEDDINFVRSNYEELEKTEQNLKKYPLLKEEKIYQIKKIDSNTSSKLESLFIQPSILIRTLESDNEIVKTIYKQLSEQLKIEVNKENIFPILANLPKETVKGMLETFKSQMDEMPDSILKQGSIACVKEEYTKIGISLSKLQTNYIIIAGAKMLGIALLIMVVSILILFFGSRLAATLALILRTKVFESVIGFSKTEMKEFGTASLITRTTNDIQQVQQVLLMMLRVVFYAPIIAIGGIFHSISADTSMLWIIILAVITLFIIIFSLFAIVMPKFKILQDLVDRLNLVTREILNGIPVIRAFSNEKHEEKRFDEANQNLNKVSLFVNKTMSLMMPLMMLLMNVVSLAIVWFGAKGIDAGTFQVGDMMAYIQYAMQIIMAFLMISMVSILLPRASISAKRILEVINKKSIIKEPLVEVDGKGEGYVEFDHVSFRYPDAFEDVISDVSFVAKPGTTTAFIGSTGSGKSTLINLIPRFYDVTEGKIKIDGVDVRDMNTHTLRSKIGYVPQKGILFTGTIASNVKYGDETISDKKMKNSCDIAQASEFIEKLEKGYDSPISQGGTNVSGGQRQRLSIARAIAIDPKIYIFDDSFSALDFKTDAKLRKELAKVTQKSTVFIVAQRISTILHADQIVVLNEGKVAGIGTHKQLLKNCDVYKEIALSQLSEEELKNA